MLALLFFIIDFCSFTLFNQWFIYSLITYFVLKQCLTQQTDYPFSELYLPIGLLLLQDVMIYGRFGLALLYVVPVIIFSKKGKNLFFSAHIALSLLLLVMVILIKTCIVEMLIFGYAASFFMTIKQIYSILGVGSLVLLGMLSNRLFPLLGGKGRKVWTPNRKDAS